MLAERIVRLVAALSVSGLIGACGTSSATGGPHFDATARPVPCDADADATHCFDLTVRNHGPDQGSGECWVVAIKDFQTELARSEPVVLRDVDDGEQVRGTTQMRFSNESGDVTFPAHCDPGLDG